MPMRVPGGIALSMTSASITSLTSVTSVLRDSVGTLPPISALRVATGPPHVPMFGLASP